MSHGGAGPDDPRRGMLQVIGRNELMQYSPLRYRKTAAQVRIRVVHDAGREGTDGASLRPVWR